ncbi:MAG: leucine--tRNA ligase [Spirochaetes bacterium]|nr:leucine--tRNA ligase [Spirochaetota bacterium]
MEYEHAHIERKWQSRWRENDLFRADNDSAKPKFYALVFFPYPSGAGISIGHCKNYIPVDVTARFKRMQGYNVLQPMGWDAFGQPAENEAIKQGRNPKEMVPEYAANYKRQLDLVGISYDWSREINSSHPEYYRWTQWLFLLLYKRGLAYRADAPINWCPSCATGLANEEVVGGKCWRCGHAVEKRPLPQWYFRITDYADRLISGLDAIQWPEGIKMMQREWIGRSEGAAVDFTLDGSAESIRVFTTRPDTLWGATFIVLAPEHPLVETITAPDKKDDVKRYIAAVSAEKDIDRQAEGRKKTGVFIGAYATNPVNGEKIPVYIADYVLMGYGTGAIMAVPAHDQRDFEFARQFELPIVLVYRKDAAQTAETMTAAVADEGVMCIGPMTGSPNNKETVGRVISWLEEKGMGHGVVNYRLRDWLISRQRYWGAPIPIIHCEKCGAVSVPEDQLPVLLPDVERYQPTGTGASPLAGISDFVHVTCPKCGGSAQRETDTMGGFACSSWYFLRFADPKNSTAPFSPEAMRYWLPVDLYSGGAEHAVMHLLYARFWTKVLHDAGLVSFDEPFTRLRNQGMLLAWTAGRRISTGESEGDDAAADEPLGNWKVLKPEEKTSIPEAQWEYRWVKMSKSLKNVVTPDEMAERYGADALRLYILFAAPFEDTILWKDAGGVESANRYILRVWRIWYDLLPHFRSGWKTSLVDMLTELTDTERALERKLHQTIRKAGDDIEAFHFNTAIAALMEYTNELSVFRNSLEGRTPTEHEALLASEALEIIPLLLAPIAPHTADELWEHLGKSGFTAEQPWPAYNTELAANDEVTVVFQVNGKLRGSARIAIDTDEARVKEIALADPKVKDHIAGRTIVKVIFVPRKLVNIVVK